MHKLLITIYQLLNYSGYMSPEYALEGIFSIKSDVFSFGVLLLEIVSGKKNTGLYRTDSLNLLGYVSSNSDYTCPFYITQVKIYINSQVMLRCGHTQCENVWIFAPDKLFSISSVRLSNNIVWLFRRGTCGQATGHWS